MPAGVAASEASSLSGRKTDRAPRKQNNSICLACHERGDRTYWNGSTHETRGLMCSNCHTVMKNVTRKFQLNAAFAPDTCFQCHKDKRAQNYFSSHMPVREGKITCSNCHNPHGSATEAMLRENSVNDNCYKCHAEKRGPFLWEHNPVRENCLNCHDPHGSTKMAMLKVQSPQALSRMPWLRQPRRRQCPGADEQPVYLQQRVCQLPFEGSWLEPSVRDVLLADRKSN